ncbi:MAG TPA: Coenzyme F420 hydrogenase/dehydrogenase, beta subunit C-terminal domain [Solirubrobacteraceae bacterium]|nr:Coenzyme F420 hydrogenase/dehydrogenase, beta subunit C-terminal domain [Solirubrobacteraceae bacterium]
MRALALDQIVEAGLCIGCGLCQSLAGHQRVAMLDTVDGRQRPVAVEPLDEPTLTLINSVCPGVRVDGADRRRLAPGTQFDRIWGPAATLVIGHASDPQLRHEGSSGGVLSALAEHMLKSGEVEMVLHVAASARRPARTVAHVSTDRAQLLRAAGSRYGPAAPLVDLAEILARGRPFAFIGKPCDVSAIRALARVDPRVDEQLRYALAMVCGGASDLTKTWQALERLGIGEQELSELRYRGRGCPGPMRVATSGGEVRELSYEQMWGDESAWRLQSRCMICPDPLGDSADIVAGDCWEGGSPAGEDEGFNAILVRTERGQRLFGEAVRTGALVIDRPIGFRDMDRFQPHQVRRRRAVWARLVGMRAAGLPTVRARGLRLRSLAIGRPPWELVREAYGAHRRARSGRLGEAPPVPERDRASAPGGARGLEPPAS